MEIAEWIKSKKLEVMVLIIIILVLLASLILNPQGMYNKKPTQPCCQSLCESKGLECWSFSKQYINCVVPEEDADKGYSLVFSFYIYDTNLTCSFKGFNQEFADIDYISEEKEDG